jgi:hypothetical protein
MRVVQVRTEMSEHHEQHGVTTMVLKSDEASVAQSLNFAIPADRFLLQ